MAVTEDQNIDDNLQTIQNLAGESSIAAEVTSPGGTRHVYQRLDQLMMAKYTALKVKQLEAKIAAGGCAVTWIGDW